MLQVQEIRVWGVAFWLAHTARAPESSHGGHALVQLFSRTVSKASITPAGRR